MDVHVAIKGQLELSLDDDLDERIPDLIKAALTFENEDRKVAAREKIPGWWDMPETISLWQEEQRRSGHVLLMPRGFADKLVQGVNHLGGRIAWDDQRVAPVAAPGYFRPVLLRSYQHEAEVDLIKSEQGFYECPPGGGKTVAALATAATVNLRTLVIVDKADLLEQWRERASQPFLDRKTRQVRGFDLSLDLEDPRSVGKIGQDVWEERDLTIALRQSLWSRIDELDMTTEVGSDGEPINWWQSWGVTIFDEGHHLQAATLSEVSRRCRSRYMLGMSATPARTPTQGKIVCAYIGPIRHRTSKARLREEGILVMPSVEVIKTNFETEFHPTHDVEATDECKVPGCKKKGAKHMHRNNYTSCVKKLQDDADRNKLIAAVIAGQRGHYHLVYSRYLKHLDLMKKAVEEAGWDGPIFFLRGEENAKKISRDIVAEIEKSEECVVFSTVADEGLDIPILDRLHLVFPMRMQGLVQQVVGRVERAIEGKDETIVYDYDDHKTECFESQGRVRDSVYRMDGYPIKTIEASDLVPA